MGTLVSKAEIDVWVQASVTLLWRSGDITPEKYLTLYVQNPAN